ncbi:MAG: adenylate/guanylate cyclase domain-containing protein [Elusimicrobia bacterium]|nr:adenylate/guanylate cyclase domain-containing protein [Elusimicrobiota bacterium]
MAEPTAPAKRPRSLFPLYFAAAWTLALGGIYMAGLLDNVESYWGDHLFSFNEARLKTGDPRIIVAAIDEGTIQDHGWPMPRGVYARLVDKLVALDVKAIGFDVLLLNPYKFDEAGDRALVEATRRSKRTVHLGLDQMKTLPGRDQPIHIVEHPIEGLEAAAVYLGHPNVDETMDLDGHLRRMPLFSKALKDPKGSGLPWPTLDPAVLAVFEGKPLADYAKKWGRLNVYVNFRRVQIWSQSEFMRAKGHPNEEVGAYYQPISMSDILEGRLTEAQKRTFNGALVLVGATATGAFDHYASPFQDITPGVEFHASLIDNMMHGDYLRRTDTLTTLLIILAFIWLPLLVLHVPPAAGFGAMAAMLAGWVGFTNWQFLHQVRYEFVAPALGLLVSFIGTTVQRVLKEGAEKRAIQQTFGRFVSPDVVKDLAQNPEKARIGAQQRVMTVFFLDIAHFTNISEKLHSDQLFEFLNVYLSALTDVVEGEQKGTIDKYIGDCIMAFWNAPLDQPDHRARACVAAVRCQQVMAELNRTHKFSFPLPETPAARIGLNSGPMNVGFTGSRQKLQYTVLGDEVNLGSRLEGANKFFGSSVMVSESCFEGGREAVEGRLLGQIRVVGKQVPIRVYELLAEKGKLSEEWRKALPAYEKGIELFLAERFSEARAAFGAALEAIPDDKPSRLYCDACDDYAAIPPHGEWRVFNLTAK